MSPSRRPGPEAWALVARLHEPRDWRALVRGRWSEDLALLEELLQHATPAIVPHVMPWALATDGGARAAATRVVERALADASASELQQLDEQSRRLPHGLDGPFVQAWRALRRAELSRTDSMPVVCAASCHWSGYLREAAVERLDGAAEPRVLPFLLLRLNDWVPQVAARAYAAAERRVDASHAAAWLEWLPLLERLGPATRRSADPLVARVDALLREPSQRDVLVGGLVAREVGTRRRAIRVLAASPPPPDAAALVARVLADPDAVARTEALALADRWLDDEALARLAPVLLAEPLPWTRSRALSLLARRLDGRAERRLREAILDAGAPVRQVARHHLARLGVAGDWAATCREALAAAPAPARVAAALAALAESGSPGGVAVAAAWLTHPRATVRREAVRAVGALDADGYREWLLAMLADPSARVARAARGALSRASTLDLDQLRQAVRTVPNAHGRLEALALASRLPKWDGIVLLLEAIGSGDAAVRERASRRVADWIERRNGGGVRPTPEQLAAIHRLWPVAAPLLEAGCREAFEHTLRYWTGR